MIWEGNTSLSKNMVKEAFLEGSLFPGTVNTTQPSQQGALFLEDIIYAVNTIRKVTLNQRGNDMVK